MKAERRLGTAVGISSIVSRDGVETGFEKKNK